MRFTNVLALAALVVGVCAFASNAQAQLTYFDANVVSYDIATKTGSTTFAPNTTLVDGSPVPTTGSSSGFDNIWRRRENDGFGNKPNPNALITGTTDPYLGDILETRGDFAGSGQNEDTPTLKTTVDVPVSDRGLEKSVWVFFWTDAAAWQVAASLTNSNDGQPSVSNPIQPIFAGNNAGVDYDIVRDDNSDPLYDNYVRIIYDASDSGATLPDYGAPQMFFPTDSLLTTTDGDSNGGAAGNRRLWAGFLGNTVLGDELTVFVGDGFIDPLHDGSGNNRIWYDGIGYGDVQQGLDPLPDVITEVPEPTSLALLGVLAGGLLAVRRRRG